MLNNKQISKLLYDFVVKNKSICEDAYNNNWLGYYIDRNTDGLLGYMRYSYQKQIKTLLLANNQIKDDEYPVPFPFFATPETLEIYSFFNSDYFKNEVKKNGSAVDFYNKEHFKILEKIGKSQSTKIIIETAGQKSDRIISFENWLNSLNKYYQKHLAEEYETIF